MPFVDIPRYSLTPPVIPAAAGIQRGGDVGNPTNPKNHSSDNHPLTTIKLNALLFLRELMNQAAQQIPSNPALDFAQSILEVTNNGLELIEILRDIANDCDEVASTNDRIAATNILNDRAFGKCPKQVSPSPGPGPRNR